MYNYKNVSHRRWDSEYHLVLVPKKRMKVIFIGGNLRRYLGNFLQDPAKQTSIVLMEGSLLKNSIEDYSYISKKNAQPKIVGYLKGKGTLEIARDIKRNKKHYREKIFSEMRCPAPINDRDSYLSAKGYSGEPENEKRRFAQSSWM
ncbi:MAG: transposase [Methylomicrobium sp.]